MTKDMSHTSERSCVVCRETKSPDALLRLLYDKEHKCVCIGKEKTKGRGAYVCISHDCLTSLSTQSLSRAFKTSATVNTEEFVVDVHRLAKIRFIEYIGLARRMGQIDVGVEKVADLAKRKSDDLGVILLAHDLSERSLKKLQTVGTIALSCEELGNAAGMGRVGAMRIRSGRCAFWADYWLRVWYESRPRAVLEVA